LTSSFIVCKNQAMCPQLKCFMFVFSLCFALPRAAGVQPGTRSYLHVRIFWNGCVFDPRRAWTKRLTPLAPSPRHPHCNDKHYGVVEWHGRPSLPRCQGFRQRPDAAPALALVDVARAPAAEQWACHRCRWQQQKKKEERAQERGPRCRASRCSRAGRWASGPAPP